MIGKHTSKQLINSILNAFLVLFFGKKDMLSHFNIGALMTANVAIFGGGISGLTVAHEMVERGYKVKLYEKGSELGGMARSRREPGGIPSEHSWRGYAPFYDNFFDISKRIPISQGGTTAKTVYDNLSKETIEFYFLYDKLHNKEDGYVIGLSAKDYAICVYYGLKYLCSNKRRAEYYSTELLPLLKGKLSDDGYDYMVKFLVGPGLGMEQKDVSYAHFFKVPTIQKPTRKQGNKWNVMNQPTSEAWFDPWYDYLKGRGVEFFFNKEVRLLVKGSESAIDHATLSSGEIVKADEYVVAINPFQAEELFGRCALSEPASVLDSQFERLALQHSSVNHKTTSNQISFRIGFDKEIKFPITNVAFTMMDSEFNITWYPQELFWRGTASDNLGKVPTTLNSVKSLWSGTVIVSYRPGSIYNKVATELDKKQLQEEIVGQIFRSEEFKRMMDENNDFTLTPDDISYFEIWYEWKYTPVDGGRGSDGVLKDDENHWVNNVHNQQFRPDQKTGFSNLHIGGSHTKTTIDVWSMEGAVESGKRVARNILLKREGDSRDSRDTHDVLVYDHVDSVAFTPLKAIDDLLYTLGLPNIVDVLLLLLVVTVLVLFLLPFSRYVN